MFAPHNGHMRLARSRHAEHLATAERHRLAAGTLRPQPGTARIEFHGRRAVAAVASVVLTIVVATGVAATVAAPAPSPSSNANADGGSGFVE